MFKLGRFEVKPIIRGTIVQEFSFYLNGEYVGGLDTDFGGSFVGDNHEADEYPMQDEAEALLRDAIEMR